MVGVILAGRRSGRLRKCAIDLHLKDMAGPAHVAEKRHIEGCREVPMQVGVLTEPVTC